MNSILKLTLGLASVLPAIGHANSFEEASQYLDTDGSLIAFIDFQGDGKELGDQLNAIYQDALSHTQGMPLIPVDFSLLFENLGFGSIRSIGFSSKELEPGLYVNRFANLLNGTPSGLFGMYSPEGQEETTFTAAALAPADATGAACGPINLTALTDTYQSVFTQIMGPMGEGIAQQQLSMPVPGTELQIGHIIDTLSARWEYAYKLDLSNMEQPEIALWVQVEGAGSLLEELKPLSEQMPVVFTENDGRPTADFSALLGSDAPCGLFLEAQANGDLVIYTDANWTACSEGPRLADDPKFQSLTAHLPTKALWFSYSDGFDLMKSMEAALAADPETAKYLGTIEKSFDLLIGDFYKPAASASYFKGDTLVTELYASYSTKQIVMLLPTIYGGGLSAAMAIPAFQKVRTTSQEKAVTNNLRQIAAAADQYFLENGVKEVAIEKLIGPDAYIRELTPVAGESYEGMIIKMGEDISVTLGNGQVITQDF